MMKTILAPARALMGRMRYLYKFSVIFMIFLVPLAILGTLVFKGINQQDAFLEQERQGLEYIGQLRHLLEDIPRHRGMVNAFLLGDTAFKKRISSADSRIDQDFSNLKKTDRELAGVLNTVGMVDALDSQWEQLKQNDLKMKAGESFREHSRLIKDLIELITHVAESSSLILDPRVDTHYLMDALVNWLPPMTDAMGQTRGLGSGIAARGEMTAAQRIQLAVLMNGATTNNRNLSHALTVSDRKNSGVRDRLNGLDRAAVESAGRFFNLVESRIMAADGIRVKADEIFSAGTAALNADFQLYDIILPTLDDLLAERLAAGQDEALQSLMMLAAMLLVVVYLFSGFYMSVGESIRKISQITARLAQGDLSARMQLDGHDEMQHIAEGFNTMAQQFTEVISNITHSSQQLASSSEEYSIITDQTNQSLAEQQLQTDQVATAMNEMSATVQEVTRSVSSTAEAAVEANRETEEGHKVVEEAVQAIQKLAAQIETAAEVIHQLEQDSEGISSIMDVIRSVAEQTNLLALNAAIKAARAGEQGRGFAIVADEVRTLAGRTQESTEEINQMIDKLQMGSRQAVEVMARSREQAQAVVGKASQAGVSLTEIDSAVRGISDMSNQIASASEEQSATVEEINRNVTVIAGVATQTATGAQQTASSSEDLARLAAEMQSLVGRFRIALP